MTMPKVSVLMPVFNAEAFLAEAIQSVLQQDFSDFELIVINDGSTDRSAQVLNQFTDGRLKVHHHAHNRGLIAVLNEGISIARGQYIARMDADDVCLSDRLSKQVNWLEQNPDVVVLGSFFYQWSGSTLRKVLLPSKPEEVAAEMLFRSAVAHPTTMLRAEVFSARQWAYDRAYIHAEDFELWSRILAAGYQIANHPEPLLKYRVHTSQVTQVHAKEKGDSRRLILKRQLELLGMQPTVEEVQLHDNLAKGVSLGDEAGLRTGEDWLTRLIHRNRQNGKLNEQALQKVTGRLWFNACANAGLGLKSAGLYRSSPLSKVWKPTLRERVRFWIKLLINHQPGRS